MTILRDYYSGGYSSPFGDPRENGRTHRGQDISHSTKPGTVGVPALRSGTVVSKTVPSVNHGFGYGITVRSILDDGNLWDISYSHGPWASSQGIGERVTAGQIILHEGTSGSTSGSCVHIEQKRVSSGIYIDPLPEIKKIAARDNGAEGSPSAPVNVAPAFPLPAYQWFGWADGGANSISGYYGNGDSLARAQARLKERGWDIVADGRYGVQTQNVVTAFQREKGLTVDGKIGPATWAALWTTPVT